MSEPSNVVAIDGGSHSPTAAETESVLSRRYCTTARWPILAQLMRDIADISANLHKTDNKEAETQSKTLVNLSRIWKDILGDDTGANPDDPAAHAPARQWLSEAEWHARHADQIAAHIQKA